MKSVRFDPGLQGQLREAARAAGITESEFIRLAVAERSRELLGNGLEQRLTGIVGAIHSSGGRARQASERYVELLRGPSKRGPKRRS